MIASGNIIHDFYFRFPMFCQTLDNHPLFHYNIYLIKNVDGDSADRQRTDSEPGLVEAGGLLYLQNHSRVAG